MTETDDDFLFFSREYAQAVDAIDAIEKQAELLNAFGGAEELRAFAGQFIVMASSAASAAEAQGQANFAVWFRELVARAERVIARGQAD